MHTRKLKRAIRKAFPKPKAWKKVWLIVNGLGHIVTWDTGGMSVVFKTRARARKAARKGQTVIGPFVLKERKR